MVPDETNFLNTVTRQLAIGIERELLNEQSRETQRLQESERLHQTILNSISHEMRTPLTAIIGASSALQNAEISGNKDTRKELTDELTQASERLNFIVENLLDTSRLASGLFQLKREWSDIKDIVSISIDQLSRVLEQHIIHLDIPDNLPFVYVDFHLMEQAISNILRNSASMAPANSLISIDARAGNNLLIISVSDQGPGIPEQSLYKIFERFYRVPGTPTGGVGLGLWLVKSIIELHGGKISVANQVAGGVCFSIQLPIEKQPEIPKESENVSE